MAFNLAIDGPAGAGKSTIAKQLAKKLDVLYVDTGAMYRAMALYFLRLGLAPEDGEGIAAACEKIQISLSHEADGQHVYLNGEDVNGVIRTAEVSAMASQTSVYPAVRKKLVQRQQEIAADMDLIMDGRDIGTVVLPQATVKVYLTADAGVRAKRRYDELVAAAKTPEEAASYDYEKIRQEIIERDERDMNREISPLRQAEDAICVDTSDMNIDQVVETILALCKQHR